MTESESVKSMNSPVSQKVVKYPTLNEAEFYEVYLTLANLSKPRELKLSDKAITLLSAYLAKPLEFAIEFNNKKTVMRKETGERKTLAVQLGSEIGVAPSYTYYLMKELRDKQALVIDEDNLLRPNVELNKLRVGAKANLSEYTVMQFEYVFKAKVVDTDEYNESNIPESGS